MTRVECGNDDAAEDLTLCSDCPDAGAKCECGYEPGTFACKIRHVHLNTGDAKASRDLGR